MASLASTSIFGPVPIANPTFVMKKNGKAQTKKTPNFDEVAVWTSSSSAEWNAGIEDGTAGRRSKKVCYMNKGAWVEQLLDMHAVVAGGFYTISVDAVRSAEKADFVIVELFLGNEQQAIYSDNLGKLVDRWQTFSTKWQAPADITPGQNLRIRFTMINQWGQIDNVSIHCGKTATSLDDSIKAEQEEKAKIEAAAADFEKDGTPTKSWAPTFNSLTLFDVNKC